MNRRQLARTSRAEAKAQAKLAKPVATHPQIYSAPAEDESLLASMSRSPSLTPEIKTIRALLQGALEAKATSRQGAELLKIFSTLSRTAAAIFIQASVLMESSKLDELGVACEEILAELLPGNTEAVEEFRTAAAETLSRTNLQKLNDDAIADLPTSQRYLIASQSVWDGASSTLSPESELALARFWLQKALDANDTAGAILLLKQIQTLALNLVTYGRSTGVLVNKAARRTVAMAVVGYASDVLKAHAVCFEDSIDDFRAKLAQRFEPQPEQQQLEQQ